MAHLHLSWGLLNCRNMLAPSFLTHSGAEFMRASSGRLWSHQPTSRTAATPRVLPAACYIHCWLRVLVVACVQPNTAALLALVPAVTYSRWRQGSRRWRQCWLAKHTTTVCR